MNEFASNRIVHNSELIAQELRQTRANRKISLEKAAQQTGINQKYLSALESGNWRCLPAGIYGKKFLTEYALYLGLDKKVMSDLYDREVNATSGNQTDRLFTKITPRSHYAFNLPKLIQTLTIVAAAIICLLYLGLYVKKIVTAPSLILNQPAANITTSTNQIVIDGQTEVNANVEINGQTVLVQANGKFSETINLKTGLNIVAVSSQKKYSKTSTITRQIFVK